MQVIASPRPLQPWSVRRAIAVPFVLGTVLVVLAVWVVSVVFFTGFLDQYMPNGRATTYQVVTGILAWAFGLTAPGVFALVGVGQLDKARRIQRARRPHITPANRAARSVGDDCVLAIGLRIPDGTRVVPELVVGPFGVAVIEELPPASAIMSRGIRSWEIRVGNGKVRTIENPLERAARDADRVRAWFAADDSDNVVEVYAVVVGDDSQIPPHKACGVIAPNKVAAWLAALPPQRSLDGLRRERVVRLVRAAALASGGLPVTA
ncbi:MAG: hypothetical protein ACAH65_05685 [Chloroflexota bacterium]